MKRSVLFKNGNSQKLKDMLETYKSDPVNIPPLTEKELFKLYENNTDPIIAFIRETSKDNVFVLGNEVRAMFGHLADYRLSPYDRKNLSDAYGHFRRLNIDALKLLCNDLDKILFSYLKTHRCYDYTNVNDKFLFEYSSAFFKAQTAYLDAQLSERTGSDRNSGNIIKKYHEAAKFYAETLYYLCQNRKGLVRAKWRFISKTVVTFVLTAVGLFLSFVS